MFVKVLDIPTLLSGAPGLVREYYGPLAKALALDYILVGLYLAAGQWLAKRLSVPLWVGSASAAVIISGGFFLYFVLSPPTGSFFSRWFRKARGSAILYDILLVACIARLSTSISSRI